MTRYLAVYLMLAAGAVPAGNWPTFRGPQRTGVSSETKLLKSWPEGGPPLVWKAEGLGRGYSSLAIFDGKIFTLGDGTTADDPAEYLMAYEQATGKPVWKTKTGDAWNDRKPDWQSSRSTPSTDGKLVYVITPYGTLVACEFDTGKEVWRKDFKAEFDGKKGDSWGFSESPLIDGDKLVCTPGGETATVIALNKTTGDVLWKAAQAGNRGAGHASIVISEVGGQRVYVQLTASGAIGIRAEDGVVLWTYGIDQTTAVCPTPIIKDDLVFIAAGYKRGGALVRQVSKGDGKVDVEEVYPMKPELANKHGGVIRIGDYIYADSDDGGLPYCAELLTGAVKWKARASGKNSASVTAADGHLYIHFADGTMVLANADPAAYKEVGSFQIPGTGERPSWSHPVIFDGKLFLRENNSILCYNIHE
ncbi:PQQ-like beta-propeller repeat protein [Schlesneria paludicola]|uniref:PQQ-like beta-propeller repeat protein n=1 Tax=Schlesneria paludicola TaxID=360056 RepID=UPI001ED8EDB1|nr:PQQ-like beta-propeller repeat protein [Schlesneria paludicola]